jgi:hypothetical protein
MIAEDGTIVPRKAVEGQMHMQARTPEETYAVALQRAQKTFAELEPIQAAHRAGVSFGTAHENGGTFELAFFGTPFQVHWPEGNMQHIATGSEPDIASRILLLHYLITADGTPTRDRWISFRNLPGGLGYDAAFQQRANLRLSHTFETNRVAFETAARALAGERLSFGDASFLFRLLPRVWLAVVLNLADEEFPADANILFDAAVSHYLPTEDLAVLGGMLASRLVKAARGS